MGQVCVIGLDLAKRYFQVHGVDTNGKVVVRKRLTREQVLSYFAQLPRCVVGMEACGGAHHWARELAKLGHEPRLMAPHYVKPYVKTNKNDAADAEAICEAVSRPSMRFVAVKSQEQQDVLALHRVRARLVRGRTALVNEIRGLLYESGVVLPKGIGHARTALPQLTEDLENVLTPLQRDLFSDLYTELVDADERIAKLDGQLKTVASTCPACQRLREIPGVGVLASTALVATVGDARCFKNGRELAAWLGIVPRQHSSGGKERLLGISKRGDKYLRWLLIHGGRAVLRFSAGKDDARSHWITRLAERRGKLRAAVAQANKIARTAWVILARGEEYQVAA